jgi:hypothetical protein
MLFADVIEHLNQKKTVRRLSHGQKNFSFLGNGYFFRQLCNRTNHTVTAAHTTGNRCKSPGRGPDESDR